MNYAVRLVCLGVFLISFAFADDEPTTESGQEKQLNQKLQKWNQKYAEEFVFTVDRDKKPLEMVAEPVFNWLNPARVNNPRIQRGAVYVWTRNGRAEVMGTIFSVSQDPELAAFYQEFHSLATGPLRATVQNTVKWDTPEAGLTFADLPSKEAPANTAALRMVQMRAMARKFSGYSINYDDKQWGLNLLPQPLYRMPKPTPEVLDQSIFTLISTAGTDPEILLVIEARKVNDMFRWQYAICRFTDLKTFVFLDDNEVWSFKNGTNGPSVDADIKKRYRFITVGSVALGE